MHSSWTYQGPPLCPIHLFSPQKGENFVVGKLWLQFLTEIVRNFHRPRFSTLKKYSLPSNIEPVESLQHHL